MALPSSLQSIGLGVRFDKLDRKPLPITLQNLRFHAGVDRVEIFSDVLNLDNYI